MDETYVPATIGGMNWVPITEADVKSRLSDFEVEDNERIANDAIGATKLQSNISQVISLIRGAILANPACPYIGPDGTIPDFSLYHACVLVRHMIIELPPVAEGFTDPRRDAQRDAMKHVAELKSMDARAFDPATTSNSTKGSYGGNPYLRF